MINFRIKKKRKAFTLIEILIALVIFSFAMIISSGIFSMVIGSQSAVSVNSEVNKEGQRIVRQISDDVINAGAIGTVSRTGDGSIIYSNVKGILFLTADNTVLAPSQECVSNMILANCVAKGIVLFGKDNIKIYKLNGSSLDYAVSAGTNLKLDLSGRLIDSYVMRPLLSSKVEIDIFEFRGLACYLAECNNMPYVQTEMVVQTKDYDNKSADHRAKIRLKTKVSGRSY